MSEREQADFDRAQVEPWKARDFPLFNEWLKSNEQPLSLVVAGTRRLRYYNPWALRPAVPLMFALLPTEQASRTWARSLVLRAMLRLNEGNIAGAEEDLIACHRLGRLIGMSPCLIGALVSYAIETLAFQGDAALMEHGKLNARDALAYQARLRTLPPLPVIVDVFDRYERLSYLDTIKAFIRDPQYRPEAVAALAHSSDSRLISDRLSAFWNEVFRVSNKVCDKWAAAAGLPATERQKAFDTLGEQMKRDAAEVIGKDLFDKFMAAEGPDQMKMIAEKFRGMVQEFAADPTRASKLPGSIFKTTTPAECGRQMGKVLVCLLLTRHQCKQCGRGPGPRPVDIGASGLCTRGVSRRSRIVSREAQNVGSEIHRLGADGSLHGRTATVRMESRPVFAVFEGNKRRRRRWPVIRR